MKWKSAPASFKAEEDGTFEALVSVFGNVDAVGDRVVKGAFSKSLERWKESGDPIPVIWSHKWDDPFAHIGQVLEAEETEKGLRIKAQMDMTDPFASKVQTLLKTRRVKEFSFAYDIPEGGEKEANGANELREINLIEVGPTLRGVNPETQLLAAKGLAIFRKTDEGWEPATEAEVKGLDLKALLVQVNRLDGASEELTKTIAHWASVATGSATSTVAFSDGTKQESAKAGRTLSAKNEGDLRQAKDLVDEAKGLIDVVLKQVEEEGKQAEPTAKATEEPQGQGAEEQSASPFEILLKLEALQD